MTESQRSAGELEFIDQMARKMMVELCDKAVRCPEKPIFTDLQSTSESQPYLDHMKDKSWVSKDGSRILSAGWSTAARFLKR